jgi:hypothetical protein
VLEKVRKSALNFTKSSNKTVKNKAAAFKDFALAKVLPSMLKQEIKNIDFI